jgi:UDP-N-acetylglucosamine 2-epimerase
MAKNGISSDDIVMRKISGVSVISISDKFKQITNDFNEVLYNFVSSYSNDKKFTIIKPTGFDEARGIIKDAHITLTDSGYIALKELEQGLSLSDNQNNSVNVNINNMNDQARFNIN